MIASLSREIGWLEQCTIPMILKQRTKSLTSEVYYFMVLSHHDGGLIEIAIETVANFRSDSLETAHFGNVDLF